jgi:hypothetical protein
VNTTTAQTPTARTPEYQALLAQYKTNLLKYQKGPRWHFGGIESGLGFNDTEITIEEMRAMAENVSPTGEIVKPYEVVDVTPSYGWICATFPDKYGGFDYDQYSEWIKAQKEVFYYGRSRENFHPNEAFRIAAALGRRKVILEDYS